MLKLNKIVPLIICLFAMFPHLHAQEYRATLLGTVTDARGAAVLGATVTAINAETKVAVTTVTNRQGIYSVPLLNPGTYSLKVEHPGFRTTIANHIELQVSAQVRLNVTMPVGPVTSSIDVTGTPPMVESGTASRQLIVDAQEMARLPLNGENPYTLVDQAPGVTHTTSNSKFFRPFDYGAINDFSINGGPPSRNSLLVDGIPVDVDAGRGQNRVDVSYIPPS
ncbi:MAG: carboxypeptidase regulatory-like domain-containing protein, partial [Bryocella sp.]